MKNLYAGGTATDGLHHAQTVAVPSQMRRRPARSTPSAQQAGNALKPVQRPLLITGVPHHRRLAWAEDTWPSPGGPTFVRNDQNSADALLISSIAMLLGWQSTWTALRC